MPLQAGDWVRTKSGFGGKILLVSRLSAFIDIEGHDEIRARPHLLSELTKIDPPKSAEGGTTENKSEPNLATK
jgi:hypothetical protein